MPSQPFTVEALERERQQRLKEAVANEPSKREKEEKRDRLAAQVDAWRLQKNADAGAPPTCTSYEAAEAIIIKAIKAAKEAPALRLDLTRTRLSVVPADVLRLGESLIELSVVGNTICELPADLDLCKHLRVLNLAANELSGLPNLSGMRELAHVGLAYNSVSDAGLSGLNRSLPPGLQSLDLAANELCDLARLLDTFDEKFNKLCHLSLQHNPLAIRSDYKTEVAKSNVGAHLTLLDGKEVTAEIREGVAAPGAEAAAAPPPAEGAEELDGEEGAGDTEDEVGDDDSKIKLRVSVMQLAGVPELAPAPAPADADADAEPGLPEKQLFVSFTLMGRETTTKLMPYASVVDFEKTSVDLVVARSVELRDQLLVHGIPFQVFVTEGPATAEGEESPEVAAPPDDASRTLLGTITTRWAALSTGEASLTQVCSEHVQPPAPSKGKGKKRTGKAPPPFTLSLTASVSIV